MNNNKTSVYFKRSEFTQTTKLVNFKFFQLNYEVIFAPEKKEKIVFKDF